MRSPECPRVILPAAGFGRRVGSPESKELLPLRDGEPLIKQALEMSLDRGWPVTLITRPEKKSLLKYVESFVGKGLEVSLCIICETKEWPHSILKSELSWNEWNLVVLPDTEFAPMGVWDEMWKTADENCDLVAATHAVEDSSGWGVLSPTENGLRIGEKQSGSKEAWGLYMFRNEWGNRILSAQLESFQENIWIELEGCRAKTLGLDLFRDLTRG